MCDGIADKLLATINKWRATFLRLDEDMVRHRPSADRWSIAEVLGHLVDSACNNHQRFVRAQECDALTFPNYEQRSWVAAGNYHRSDWPSLVALWHSYNQQLAHLIRSIPPAQLNTPCTITPNEQCTLQFLIEDYLVHLQHHLGKIAERIGDRT